MSKIWGYYGNRVDKTWFDSSNIKFAECIDNENDLKTLKVVFNNGSQYEYSNVKVQDFLLFRDDLSQGKALNKYIKSRGYEYKKLEDANLESLGNELEFRRNGGIFVNYTDGKLILTDSVDKEIFNKEVELNIDTFNTICDVLTAVGKELYVINGIESENNNDVFEKAVNEDE